MIIEVNSYEEYKEAAEKVTGTRWHVSKESLESPDYVAGFSWLITDPEIMKDSKVREIFGVNFCICDEFIKCVGKICSFMDGIYIGVLKGIEITEEDFYYVYKSDGNENLQYCSCVGNIELA